MKKNNVLEVEIRKNIHCSKDVALWNYWDTEHLDVVHDGYKESDILYDNNNFMFKWNNIKIPFPFQAQTPLFMVQHDENTLYVYAISVNYYIKNFYYYKIVTTSSCEITMNYKFYLNEWRKILKPF